MMLTTFLVATLAGLVSAGVTSVIKDQIRWTSRDERARRRQIAEGKICECGRGSWEHERHELADGRTVWWGAPLSTCKRFTPRTSDDEPHPLPKGRTVDARERLQLTVVPDSEMENAR